MDLLQNPFYILGASPRDGKARIIELFEQRSLGLDPKVCTQALADLTSPRKRLLVEVSWLPGVGPNRALEIIADLETSARDSLGMDRLSPLARVNVLAAALCRLTYCGPKELCGSVLQLARTFELVSPPEVCSLINEERVVSKFPMVDPAAVEEEIEKRRRHYGEVMTRTLRKLQKRELVQAAELIVDSLLFTCNDKHPTLIDDFIDSYEVEMKALLDERKANILSSIDTVKKEAAAKSADSTIEPIVDEIILLLRSWGVAANPILQLNVRKGKNSEASDEVFWRVQQLAVTLYNEYSKLSASQKLVAALKEVFSTDGAYREQLEEDSAFLENKASREKANATLGPVKALCEAAYASAQSDPATADTAAQRLISQGPHLLFSVKSSEIELIRQAVNNVVIAIMDCAIAFGNKTEKWSKCAGLMEEAQKLAQIYGAGSEVINQIEANLCIARRNDRLFGNMSPISKAPSLRRVNGTGFAMVGSDEPDPETGSVTSNYCFVVFGTTVLPIARYRVIPLPDGYRFLGKVPLRRSDKQHLFVSISLITYVVLGLLAISLTSNSQSGASPNASLSSNGLSNASSPREPNQWKMPQTSPSVGVSVSPDSKMISPSPEQSESSDAYPPATDPVHSSQDTSAPPIQDDRQFLSQQIEEGKTRAKQLETELDGYDSRLNELKRKMEFYRNSEMVDEYNELVPTFNSLLNERRSLYKKYSQVVSEVNENVRRYNSGIR